MKHRLAALLALLALAVPTPIALADGQGLQGTVANKTSGAPVAGQSVLLHVDRPDGTAGQTLEATTSADGGFAFPDLALSPDLQFALCTTYQDAMYHDSFAAPAGPSAPLTRDIVVYDTTDNDDTIGLASAHLVLYPRPKERTVEVVEILMFDNAGNRTYVVGEQASPDKPSGTLHFSQPAEASGTRLMDGLSQDEVQWHEGGFCSKGPVFPGERNVTYSYQLPLGWNTFRLQRPMDYAVGEVLVMTEGDQGTLSGPGVTPQGPVSVQGKPFNLYRVKMTGQQHVLDLELTGFGGAGAMLLGDPRYLAGALSAGGLFGGLLYAVVLRPRRSRAPSDPSDLSDLSDSPDEQDEATSELDEQDDDENR